MNEYLFDLLLSCSMRVHADNVEEAKKKLTDLFDCADANFGLLGGRPACAEVSLFSEDVDPVDSIQLAMINDVDATEDDECSECGGYASDGEGWDGLCGNCADKQENDDD